MRRIAVFSDIHGNDEALKAILDDMKEQNIDEIYSLGDTIAIGPEPLAVLERLIESGVKMIRGNHEDYFLMLKNKKILALPEYELEHQVWNFNLIGEKYAPFIEAWPYKREIILGQHRISLSHYAFKSEDEHFRYFYGVDRERDVGTFREWFKDESADLFLFGHDHAYFDITDSRTNSRYVSVGSAGTTKTNESCYVILEAIDETIELTRRCVHYNKDKTIDKIMHSVMPAKEFVLRVFFGMEEENDKEGYI